MGKSSPAALPPFMLGLTKRCQRPLAATYLLMALLAAAQGVLCAAQAHKQGELVAGATAAQPANRPQAQLAGQRRATRAGTPGREAHAQDTLDLAGQQLAYTIMLGDFGGSFGSGPIPLSAADTLTVGDPFAPPIVECYRVSSSVGAAGDITVTQTNTFTADNRCPPINTVPAAEIVLTSAAFAPLTLTPTGGALQGVVSSLDPATGAIRFQVPAPVASTGTSSATFQLMSPPPPPPPPPPCTEETCCTIVAGNRQPAANGTVCRVSCNTCVAGLCNGVDFGCPASDTALPDDRLCGWRSPEDNPYAAAYMLVDTRPPATTAAAQDADGATARAALVRRVVDAATAAQLMAAAPSAAGCADCNVPRSCLGRCKSGRCVLNPYARFCCKEDYGSEYDDGGQGACAAGKRGGDGGGATYVSAASYGGGSFSCWSYDRGPFVPVGA